MFRGHLDTAASTTVPTPPHPQPAEMLSPDAITQCLGYSKDNCKMFFRFLFADAMLVITGGVV